jgi:hypothetical protein
MCIKAMSTVSDRDGVTNQFKSKLNVPLSSCMKYAGFHRDLIQRRIEDEVDNLVWMNEELLKKIECAEQNFVEALNTLNSIDDKTSSSSIMRIVTSYHGKARCHFKGNKQFEISRNANDERSLPDFILVGLLAQKDLEEILMKKGEDLLQELMKETTECRRLLQQSKSMCGTTKDTQECEDNTNQLKIYADSDPYAALKKNAKNIFPEGFAYIDPAGS